MAVLVYLAYKTLLRNRLSFLLLVSAVAAGVGFQVPNTANIDGYTAELKNKGLARDTGHVLVSSGSGRPFSGADALAARVRALPFARAVTPRLVHVGSLFIGDKTQSSRIVGVDPEEEDRATRLCHSLVEGRCLTPSDERPAVSGARLARELGLRVGDEIKAALPFEREGQIHTLSTAFRVAGILEGAGGFQADYDLFVPIGALRDLFAEKDAASVIMVFVDDEARSFEYAKRVAELAPDRKVEPWWEVSEFVSNAIAGNRAISAISMTMVVFAVMIPVLALLYIHVLHERRRIGTLAALGFGRTDLFLIYLFAALIVGSVGVALGNGIGAGLCVYFRAHPIFSHAGFVVRPSMTPGAFFVPSCVILGTTLLAGIAPAVAASRSDPSLELRED